MLSNTKLHKVEKHGLFCFEKYANLKIQKMRVCKLYDVPINAKSVRLISTLSIYSYMYMCRPRKSQND